jgi:SAM-dependent methyltransferase
MNAIKDQGVYLERMAKPLEEKLKIAWYIPAGAKYVLDVGCADGTVTAAMAKYFNQVQFLGIDLNSEFIALARKQWGGIPNLNFEHVNLWELLNRPQRYNAVIFCSVLHELYSYGQGMTSVFKALANANELLIPRGRIIIRDMILDEITKKPGRGVEDMLEKVLLNSYHREIRDFVGWFGPFDSIYQLNHFLLKYMYAENWDREGPENYVPVTAQNYLTMFKLFNMRVLKQRQYLIPYLKDKWERDFKLTTNELKKLKSTTILVAEKR